MSARTRRRRLRRPFAAAELRRRIGIDEASRRLLLYFIVPTWVGAGLADWWCHKRTDIERTSGVRESVIHALMMTEGGVPAMMGLFCEVNAGVLTVTLANLAVHQATAIWDVAYAEGRREVTPTEQHVHGMLEQVPVMATAFLVALHWDQARALLGVGAERPDFELRGKRQPLPRRQLGAVLASVGAFVAAPYAEELQRCYRHRAALERAQPDGRAAS